MKEPSKKILMRDTINNIFCVTLMFLEKEGPINPKFRQM